MYLDIPNLINLSVVPGIGSTRMRSLVARFRSVESIFQSSFDNLTAVEGIDMKIAHNIKNFSDHQYGEQQYKKLIAYGGELITFWDDKYPSNLKKIYDPPVLLFMKGNLSKEDLYAISIVGTRKPTSYGKLVTEKLSRELANLGLTIVSGLARGVDTIAHSTTIGVNGRTLAIIGSGIDVIYPAENKRLAEQVMEHGALISEFPMGTGPDAGNFPRRNRIIAGLSLGTLITEAGEKSGALITANLALEYNRDIFVVPGNINSEKSKGCNQLLKEGAKLISEVDDILEELSPQLRNISPKSKSTEHLKELTGKEKEILGYLSDTPIHIDLLARQLNRSTGEILSDLLALEFKDIVKQLPGKLFVKA